MYFKFSNVQKLTILSLLNSLTLILVFTPLGMIPNPVVSFTISHIPTIVGAVILGPKNGASLGLVFGLSTLIRAIASPQGVLDPLFQDFLVSVVPRVVMGFLAGLVAQKFWSVNDKLAVVLAAFVGSATNTILVLAILAIKYNDFIVEKLNVSASAFVLIVLGSNGLIECIVCMIFALIIVTAFKKYKMTSEVNAN